MDVYQASANMIAFSEFMVITAKCTFGEQVTVKAEVAGFGQGSILTDVVFSFVRTLARYLLRSSPRVA